MLRTAAFIFTWIWSAAALCGPPPIQESDYVWRCIGPNGAVIPATSQPDATSKCQDAANANKGTDWWLDFGEFRFYVDPDAPPAPVDCSGTWDAWKEIPGTSLGCSGGQREFEESRYFTIKTAPANGGAGCPASPEIRVATEPCNSGAALASTVSPVLSVSPDGRSLRRDGLPGFWIGDTGWRAIQTLSNQEVTAYLEDRAARGVRIIQGPIVTSSMTAPPYNGGADDPWIIDSNGNLSLNEAYVGKLDHMVSEAARLGINLIVAPMWGHHNDTLLVDLGQYESYFRQLVARYANQAHISWMIGEYHKITWNGDVRVPPRDLTAAEKSRLALAARAMREEAHPDSLVAMHGDGQRAPYLDWQDDPNVDLYLHQSYLSIRDVRSAVEEIQGVSAPTKPFVQSEVFYEDNPNGGATPANIRRAMYSTAFGGGAGFTYGHWDVWQFASGWQTELGAPGALDVFDVGSSVMQRIYAETNVADQGLVVSPGAKNGRYAMALRRSDSSVAWVYADEGQNLTIRTNRLSGSGTLSGRWIDAKTGLVGETFAVSRAENVTFDPPGTAGVGNDWILELQAGAPSVPGAGELSLTFAPPTENVDGSPLRQPLTYEITRDSPSLPSPISQDADAVATLSGGLQRASLFNVPSGVYDASVRARDADGLVSAPSGSTSVEVSGATTEPPMAAIARVTNRRINDGRDVGVRDLTELGTLDWVYFGRTVATDFDQKSGGSILNDFDAVNSATFSRAAGAAENQAVVDWSDGSPTTSATSASDVVFTSTDNAGFSITTSTLSAGTRYRLVFFWSGFRPEAEISVFSDNSEVSFFDSITVATTEVWSYETEVIIEPESDLQLTFQAVNADTAGNIGMQYAYAELFPYELTVEDTFTDTNSTGIESHAPDTDVEGTGYSAEGATSGSSDVTGSGGMSIQSNQFSAVDSDEVAKIETGSNNNVVEFDWIIDGSSGHRLNISPRRVDKSNSVWVNLREPNDDYNFFLEYLGSESSLIGGYQSLSPTLDLSLTYHVRVSALDDVLRLEINGETIDEINLGSNDLIDATAISIGTAGVTQDVRIDNLAVWSEAAAGTVHDVSVSFGAQSGESVSAILDAAVDVNQGATSNESVSADLLIEAEISESANASDSVSVDALSGVSLSESSQSGESAASVLDASVSLVGGALADDVFGVIQSSEVDLESGASAGVDQSADAGSAVAVSEGAVAGESATAAVVYPVAVSNGAQGAESTSVLVNYAVDVSEAGEADEASDAALQGEISVDFVAAAEAGVSNDVTLSTPVSVAFDSESDDLIAAVATYLGDVSDGAESGITVDRQVGDVINVAVSEAALAGDSLSVSQQALVSAVSAAVSSVAAGVVQIASVDVLEGAEGAFTASGILDSEAIVISGELRFQNRTPYIRVRRLRRDGLV